MTTTPLTNNLQIVAAPIMGGSYANEMCIGDSKTPDSSSNGNYPHALERMSPVAIGGRGTSALSGPPAWSSVTQGPCSAFASTAKDPGDNSGLGGGVKIDFAMEPIKEAVAAGDVDDLEATIQCILRNELADQDKAGVEDWTRGVNVTARLIYFGSVANGLAHVKLQSLRNWSGINGAGAIVNTTADFTGMATAGVGSADVACGNAAGPAGIQIYPFAGYNETGKYLWALGHYYFLTDAPSTKLHLQGLGVGGLSTTGLLALIGGGGSPTCTQANAILNLRARNSPTDFFIEIGKNPATNESAQLQAGTTTAYKSNVAALIDQLNNNIGPGLTYASKPRSITLISPFQATGETALQCRTRDRALYELSCAYGNVAFISGYQLMPKAHADGSNPWETADGTHLNGGVQASPGSSGVYAWAGAVWGAIQMANQDRKLVSVFRTARVSR